MDSFISTVIYFICTARQYLDSVLSIFCIMFRPINSMQRKEEIITNTERIKRTMHWLSQPRTAHTHKCETQDKSNLFNSQSCKGSSQRSCLQSKGERTKNSTWWVWKSTPPPWTSVRSIAPLADVAKTMLENFGWKRSVVAPGENGICDRGRTCCRISNTYSIDCDQCSRCYTEVSPLIEGLWNIVHVQGSP